MQLALIEKKDAIASKRDIALRHYMLCGMRRDHWLAVRLLNRDNFCKYFVLCICFDKWRMSDNVYICIVCIAGLISWILVKAGLVSSSDNRHLQ